MSRKIVFHIIRQNWYRVLAAPIAEALRRGWVVECWHAKYHDGELGENQPRIDRVPKFECGHPRIIEYLGTEELGRLIHDTDALVIVDMEVSPVAQLCSEKDELVTIYLDGLTHPIASRLKAGKPARLPRYDVFALPSEQHLTGMVDVLTEDRKEVLALMHRGKIPEIFHLSTYLNSWTYSDQKYFVSHSKIVGTPSLDDIKLIDPVEVKERWGIPKDSPVVGLLPSPWDVSLGMFCGELNSCSSLPEVFLTILKHKKFNSLVSALRTQRDKHFVAAVRKFCNHNNAVLITKLRHSRQASKVIIKNVDKIIGEDNYYPHSALELFVVADVVFGFTSSAVYECIAAGTPYVDIEVPFFPKSFYVQHIAPSLSGTENWPGVVWTMSTESAVKELPTENINSFAIDKFQRKKFLNHFTTYDDGMSSGRFLDLVEEQVAVKVASFKSA